MQVPPHGGDVVKLCKPETGFAEEKKESHGEIQTLKKKKKKKTWGSKHWDLIVHRSQYRA